MARKSKNQPIKEKRPVGRPKKPIDWSQFEQLCALQCTQSEICSILHLDEETLCIRVREHYGEKYSETYKRFQESGKCSLRRNQFVISKKNASMAIWLGKIWLGQTDPGLQDTKEDLVHALRLAIREITRDSGIQTSERQVLEDKQPLLDQKFRRNETEVQIKLGSEEIMGGNACV